MPTREYLLPPMRGNIAGGSTHYFAWFEMVQLNLHDIYPADVETIIPSMVSWDFLTDGKYYFLGNPPFVNKVSYASFRKCQHLIGSMSYLLLKKTTVCCFETSRLG